MPEIPSTAEKLILVTYAEEWAKLAEGGSRELPIMATVRRCDVGRDRVLEVIWRWRPMDEDSLYNAKRLLAEKETDERPNKAG